LYPAQAADPVPPAAVSYRLSGPAESK